MERDILEKRREYYNNSSVQAGCMKHEHVVVRGGVGGGGRELGYLENGAYFWKNPGNAPANVR